MTNRSVNTLPDFSNIVVAEIAADLEAALATANKTVQSVLDNTNAVNWQNLATPLEEMEADVDALWSPISHLNSVKNSDALREAYNACLPKLSAFSTALGQNKALYNKYRELAESKVYNNLDTAQKRVVENALRDFRLSGIALDDAGQARYKDISQELSLLTTKYEENVMDATQGWQKHITDEADLAGLPESAMAGMAQAAKQAKLAGWLLTLHFPSYMPVMTYADDRSLREEMYTAFATRASDQGPNAGKWDNAEVMVEILALRHEMALLLGFANHAELSLATKMADSPQQVLDFLNDFVVKAKPQAEKQFSELTAFATETAGTGKLEAWDVSYYAEKLRQQRYAISPEELKPYFPEDKVVNGLFKVVQRLYGLDISERIDVDTWHDDVRFFDIFDSAGSLRGQFYLDLYARDKKRGGAWMDDCTSRRKQNGEVVTPIAFLTCNFSPPVGDKPALLTHDEVETLFHEFGHGLHHMLTQVDYSGVSGINGVAWDAVELPSQFMENWTWEREALDLISGHYETGEPLPDVLFERMTAARHFQSAMMMVRQLEFSLFDFRLHLEYSPDKPNQVAAMVKEVRDQVAVVQPPEFNRFANSFSHIFAGGYSAGYYSYLWAEVLSADAYSLFEEKGVFDAKTGQSFLSEILEKGGSRSPMELFVAFRGREPTIDALLRHKGIA